MIEQVQRFLDKAVRWSTRSNLFETITIRKAEYDRILALIDQQKVEIDALEYRIKTLLSR